MTAHPHSVVCPHSCVLQGPCHGPLLCRTQQGCRQLAGSRVGSTPLESCVPWGPSGAASQNVLPTDPGTAWGGSSPPLPCRGRGNRGWPRRELPLHPLGTRDRQVPD